MATDSVQPSVDPDDDHVDIADAMPPTVGPSLCLPSIDLRDRALPIRPGDLTRLLMAQPDIHESDRENLGKLGPLLGAIFHSEFYERLRELKELYGPLDPDSDYIKIEDHTVERTEESDESFLAPFEAALERANYRPLDIKVIEQAVEAPNEMGLTYVPNFSQFEHLRIYARGYTQISRVFRSAKTKFRKRTMQLDAYQRLIIALKFKSGLDLGPFVRSDVVYLRMFKDVPHVDMEMHLPEQGTKVRMRWIDKAQISSPVVMGVPALTIKLLGLSWAAMANPMLLAPLAIAPISAGVNSFFGFQRAKHKHLSSMIRNLYYLTLANNGSVLTRLIDTAEEEEYKETMLAYFFLWQACRSGKVWTRENLDLHIETFLKSVSGIEINFEIEDALSKLFRLGLARRDVQGKLQALPIDEALLALDHRWDNTFRYA
ncbi:DUF3754 domain-containing protein [Tundrisphaera lichenicola]|uniref:DUF3754 domain-containing protein n=1 Tax=Tundrisphaera lichenicola TaxID=2029860 RepID=UPI003EB8196B